MLRQHAEGLWTLDRPLSLLGMPLGLRMTVVRLRDGGLWLHSPVPMTDADQRELEALGPVRFIVAPNRFHHLHARPAKKRYPAAKLLGAPRLAEKRKTLAFDGVLGAAPDPGYAADVQQVPIGEIPLHNEVVFFHPASRTLIVTDFLFNLRQERALWAVLFRLINGPLGVPCQTRLFRSTVRDKAAFRASARRLLDWDFDRIILAHGEVVPGGGKAALRQALPWLA